MNMKAFFLMSLLICSASSWGDYSREVDDVRVFELRAERKINQERLSQLQSTYGYGLEILVASKSFDSPASVFGHAGIRFVGSGSEPWNDVVVSLEQLTVDMDKLFTNGLSGGYEVTPRVYTLIEYTNTYQTLEGRQLGRVILPSTAEQRAKLVDVLLSIFEIPDLFGDYKFIGNNCSTVLLKVLKTAGFPIYSDALVSAPPLLENALSFSLLGPYPKRYFPSATSLLFDKMKSFLRPNMSLRQKIFKRLSRKDLVEQLLQDDFWSYLDKNLTRAESDMLHLLWPDQYVYDALLRYHSDSDVKDFEALALKDYVNITQNLMKRKNLVSVTIKELVSKSSVSPDFYLSCVDDSVCFAKRRQALKQSGLYQETQHKVRSWSAHVWNEKQRSDQLVSNLKYKDWVSHPSVVDMLEFAKDLVE
ncbi:MAG: DUF4105 domain-containing protein [Bdellovibrionales bacterium]